MNWLGWQEGRGHESGSSELSRQSREPSQCQEPGTHRDPSEQRNSSSRHWRAAGAVVGVGRREAATKSPNLMYHRRRTPTSRIVMVLGRGCC